MKTKLSWLETVLLTAPFVVLAIYWNDLPARVPIHWNFRGQIDGWAAKTPGIFIIPLTALGVTALLRVLPWFDPRLRRTLGDESLMPAILPIIRLAVLLLLDTIFFVQIAVSLGRNDSRRPDYRLRGASLLYGPGKLSWQCAPELFCRRPHAVDPRKSRDVAGDASARRAFDVFWRAYPSRRPIFA